MRKRRKKQKTTNERKNLRGAENSRADEIRQLVRFNSRPS